LVWTVGQFSEELKSQELEEFEVYSISFVNDVPKEWLSPGVNKPFGFSCKGMRVIFYGWGA